MEQLLFEPPYSYIESCIAQLSVYESLGYAFLRPIEVSKILGITMQFVRDEAKLFRLDAYSICGHLRFDIGSVLSYIYKDYKEEVRISRAIEAVALSGVYDLARYGRLERIKEDIKKKRYPITSIDELLEKTSFRDFDSMAKDPGELLDWYGIECLPLPDKITTFELASILRVSGEDLAADLGVGIGQTLTYPEVYDYLVSKQLVNTSIPFSLNDSRKILNDLGQLYFEF